MNNRAKSLKDQNNPKLWIIIAVNSIIYYTILVTGTLDLSSIRDAVFSAATLLPASIAGILATVLNALPSSDSKARLVYLRWHNPLPGHRAFTKYGPADHRIDMARLSKVLANKLPHDEGEQNKAWYRLFKTVENEITVLSAHRNSLLLRDYTALSAIFIIVFGLSGAYFIPDHKLFPVYMVMLMLQFTIVRLAAKNSGIRMVTNVLAIKAAKQGSRPKP